MSTHDKKGHPWAKLSEVKAGDILTTNGGFTCMGSGERKVVRNDDNGLYVQCDDGHHYIDGQADDGEHLIGLYKV